MKNAQYSIGGGKKLKRFKLVVSLCLSFLCLGLLTFSVYAAITVNFNFASSISFNPEGVYLDVSAQVYRGVTYAELEPVIDDSKNYTLEKTSNYILDDGSPSGSFALDSWTPADVPFLPTQKFIQYRVEITNNSKEDITVIPSDLPSISGVTITEEVSDVLRIAPGVTADYRLNFQLTTSSQVASTQFNMSFDITPTSEIINNQLYSNPRYFTNNGSTLTGITSTYTSANPEILVIPKTINGSTITSIETTSASGVLQFSSATKYLIIDANLTKIGQYAFRGGTSVPVGITLPSTLLEISSNSFAANSFLSGITNISLPYGIKTVYIGMLSNLKRLEIPRTVTTLSVGSCSSLTELIIPDSVTNLLSLNMCTGLTKLTIPASVTTIGNKLVQYNTSNLKYIHIDGDRTLTAVSNLEMNMMGGSTWVRTDSPYEPTDWTKNVVTEIPTTNNGGYYHQMSAY